MKDEWISPFQEKLGDYELDIPVPAARSRKLVFPVMAAVAAAAALALLLWLPAGRKADPDRTLQPLIAAAQPQPDVLAQLPAGQLLANPPARRFAASSAPVTIKIRETTQPSTTTDHPETQETPDTPDSPATPDTPTKPAAGTPDTNQPLFPDFPETDDLPSRRTAQRLSLQAYASPFNPQKSSFIVPVMPSQVRSESDQALNEWVSNSTQGPMYGMAKVSIPETAFTNVNTHSRLPLKTGLSVRYSFGPRFQLESGLTYTYHFVEQGVPNGETEIPFSEYRLHYVGLPVKAVVPIVGGKRLHVYAGAGGEAELLVGGTRMLYIPTEEKITLNEHPFQLSLLASAGIELKLVDRLSLYAEPGAAWHIITPETLPGYYHEHPVSFDFRFGLRFDLR